MRPTPVIDLRPGSTVEREDVGRMVYAIVAHLATVADAPVDLFDALDAACHELAGMSTADHQPTWTFWAAGTQFGVAATHAHVRAAGPGANEFPLADAVGEVTTTGDVVTWHLGGHTDHCPVPPAPAAVDDRLLRLRVPAELEHAAAVRAVVRSMTDFRDEDEEARYLIAATEIFTNAVRANHRRADPPPIEVDVIGDSSHAGTTLTIADRCGGWSPDLLGPVDRESGLAIARAFVPDLAHTSIDGGCSVALPFPRRP